MPGEAGSSRHHMAAMEAVFLVEGKSWRSSTGWMELPSPAEEALVWHLPAAVSVVTASSKRTACGQEDSLSPSRGDSVRGERVFTGGGMSPDVSK